MFHFGKYYKAQIEEIGITQKQISIRSGVSDKTLDVFFNDRGSISDNNIRKILKAIDEEKGVIKPNDTKPDSSTNLAEINRMAQCLPDDLQQIVLDHLKSLELHFYRRHMRKNYH